MPGKTIGTSLNYGFAGNYAHQPDMVIETIPNAGTTNIVFGSPVMYAPAASAFGGVQNVDATLTADNFVGVAAQEIKTVLNYIDQNEGGAYIPREAVSVFERGSISVLCVVGSPERGGAVYIRTVANGGNVVGQWETAEVTGETILLPNARWGGPKDGRNIAELVLLTRQNH